LKIVLVHYHLKPGGVTTVVLHQARALIEAGDEVLIISGEEPRVPLPVEPGAPDQTALTVKVVPELHYDQWRPAPGRDIAGALLEAVKSVWNGADVFVVHNPLIRKNSALLGALKKLGRTERLLLQNHDLAEDFRPDVYANEEYPENCHYAVINSRDYSFLLQSGLKREGLHLIPNEVRSIAADPGVERRRYLYPVRGIRRKNLGEALLLSLFIPEGRTVAVTQPPTTERDTGIYLRWKELAGELGLPVEFEAGTKTGFSRLLGSAAAAVTTSVKEGFGFSFLEPWTAGLAVAGRRIGYVCADFEEAGLRFDAFYDSIGLPKCETTRDYPEQFRTRLEQAVNALYAAFGRETPGAIEAAIQNFASLLPDFGAMDEPMQEDFIRRAAADGGLRSALAEINPFLKEFSEWTPDPSLVEANREVVLSYYSRERITKILRESCRAATVPVVQSISRSRLLELFLDPSRISLVGIAR
jgi:glycosyltransferase involved in cell wall biosynthesis